MAKLIISKLFSRCRSKCICSRQ